LQILGGFCQKDYEHCKYWETKQNGTIETDCEWFDHDDPSESWIHCGYCELKEEIGYDSGVVAIVLPSAYHYECSVCHHQFNTFDSYEVDPHAFICGEEASTCDLIWDSKGAEREYLFCKEHHILCITLETALTIPQEQWREYAL
jgi:hypothetical protein